MRGGRNGGEGSAVRRRKKKAGWGQTITTPPLDKKKKESLDHDLVTLLSVSASPRSNEKPTKKNNNGGLSPSLHTPAAPASGPPALMSFIIVR
ncbi:hypothetical protein V491_04639 [Pseudogymnoascus sp. VKM F-3775]|nr:hypothetical protein V491_04639 [Pseudogymnoascus sp. VKM F-3775]